MMGSLGFSRRPSIEQGLKEFSAAPGAVLLDVRSAQEYRDGHIPGSKNLPLRLIDEAASVVEHMDAPIYVYCLSGVRSQQAADKLQEMGYENAKSIGGISSYAGQLEI